MGLMTVHLAAVQNERKFDIYPPPFLGQHGLGVELHSVHGKSRWRRPMISPESAFAVSMRAAGREARSTMREW